MKTNMLQTATKPFIAQTRSLFYCQCKIKVPLACGETCLDDCFALMEEVDRRYNSYQAGSYFDQINTGAGQWVPVDATTIAILQTVKKVSALTDGAYAISSMPLLQLWGFYQKDKQQIPSATALRDALAKVNDAAIEIDALSNHVRIPHGQRLITGSFAKALAVDRVVAHLRKTGVTDAIINAGGSSIFAINDATHPQWHVQVPDPLTQTSVRLPLTNSCLSLSGKINNHIHIDGTCYSHIVHGKSGWPAATSQVLLCTTEAFLGDVLSTAVFVVAPADRDQVLAKLAQEFSFHYRRIEENGDQIQSTCFSYPR